MSIEETREQLDKLLREGKDTTEAIAMAIEEKVRHIELRSASYALVGAVLGCVGTYVVFTGQQSPPPRIFPVEEFSEDTCARDCLVMELPDYLVRASDRRLLLTCEQAEASGVIRSTADKLGAVALGIVDGNSDRDLYYCEGIR